MDWKPNSKDLRQDGSQKGSGWLGVLQRPDGKISSELSVGVPVNGKEMDVPAIVPTLSKDEVDYLLSTDPGKLDFRNNPLGQSIIQKAVSHAEERDAAGKSPFANEDESAASAKAYNQIAEEAEMMKSYKGGH